MDVSEKVGSIFIMRAAPSHREWIDCVKILIFVFLRKRKLHGSSHGRSGKKRRFTCERKVHGRFHGSSHGSCSVSSASVDFPWCFASKLLKVAEIRQQSSRQPGVAQKAETTRVRVSEVASKGPQKSENRCIDFLEAPRKLSRSSTEGE